MSPDGRVHHAIIAAILERGHAPDLGELGAALGVDAAEAARALRSLADEHGVVLHPDGRTIWVAHPFSLSPSTVWVAAKERGFWAPCLWCAFGIAALAGEDCEIHARLGGESVPFVMRAGDDSAAVVHFSVPPRDAWENVIHWCATVQPFASERDVDAWCERHRLPRGAVVPVAQVRELGRRWYGGHAARDWRKHSARAAQAIFTDVGLVGPFWEVPVSDGRF